MRSNKAALFLPCINTPMLLAILILASSVIRVPMVLADSISDPMLVFKSPTCGCCTAWVDHMKKSKISTIIKHPKNISLIKKQLNIAQKNQACHTGTLQGYVFERHIPGAVIQQFLSKKPKNSIGLAVPGMPIGSPGMDNGKTFDPYRVFQLNKDGSRTPYATVALDKTVYEEIK